MVTSKYPYDIDEFTTKQNVVEGFENTTGDYVDAEHINSLQDAVVKIEETLGINPQGVAQDISQRLAGIEDSKSLKTPSICVYLGDPLVFNGATTISERINEFLYYNHIVFALPSSENEDGFKVLIDGILKSKTVNIYGYIDIAAIKDNDVAISTKIAQWNDLSVDGIMLDNFGYDSGITRSKQNYIIDIVHSASMSCLVSAPNEKEIFGSSYDATYNPNRTSINLDYRDAYLHTLFAVDTSKSEPYTDFSALTSKCNNLVSYRYNYKTKIFATAMIDIEDMVKAQDYFNYAQAMAILYSYDAFYACEAGYSSSSNTLGLYNNLSLVGNYYDANPQIVHDDNDYYRIGTFGKIIVDSLTHTYTLEGISVPGETIIGNVSNIQIDGIATEFIIINSHNNINMYDVNYASSNAPSNVITPVGLTHEMSDNGTISYELTWSYTQGDIKADFLLLFWKEGENVGQPLDNDNCYAILTSTESYKFRNLISEKYYNFGIAAARRVGNVIEVGTITSPSEWQNVTQGTPDFNWSLDGKLAEELKNIVYKVEIISTNGITFKNGNINTILQARVYHGSDDITDTIDPNRFQWTRTSSNPEEDAIWNFNNAGGYKQIEVDTDDVYARASFTCTVSD